MVKLWRLIRRRKLAYRLLAEHDEKPSYVYPFTRVPVRRWKQEGSVVTVEYGFTEPSEWDIAARFTYVNEDEQA